MSGQKGKDLEQLTDTFFPPGYKLWKELDRNSDIQRGPDREPRKVRGNDCIPA